MARGAQYIDPTMHTGWLRRWTWDPPARCAVCGRWPARALCGDCVQRFGQPLHRCLRCALPLPADVPTCGACLRDPPPLDACFAAVPYAYPWSGLVGRFKFGGHPGWGKVLGERMAATPGVPEAVAGADLLLPMPLARGRLAGRGFNQAVLLARALDSRRTRTGLLLRLRETDSQTTLDRRDREANVRGAFGVEPLRAAEVRAASILLVDDVMTSGASLHAAARALRQAGAARVAAVVLARTEGD